MKFLLQEVKPVYTKDRRFSIDNCILKDLLDACQYIHSYCICTLEQLQREDADDNWKDYIPLGTIEFTTEWLRKYKNISRQIPIEVPKCLQTAEFLKRNYKFVKAKDIPLNGVFFIKDISELKQFSYCGELSVFDRSLLKEGHMYQLSEKVNLLSEYRIYFLDGKIQNICNYDGDCTLFPDMKLIEKANLIYSMQKEYPRSYTMDIMVTEKGTCICECHTLLSTGLYSTTWGTDWLYGYCHGIDYVEKFGGEKV